MLAQIARHGHFDLEIEAQGDLEIDGHHTVEDVGWVLGQALRERSATAWNCAVWPCVRAAGRGADPRRDRSSGRPYLVYKAEFKSARIGDLQTELIEEFLKAFVQEGRFNLHVENLYGGISITSRRPFSKQRQGRCTQQRGSSIRRFPRRRECCDHNRRLQIKQST
jgi:imidazoleglycerol-phosphate dehydratase